MNNKLDQVPEEFKKLSVDEKKKYGQTLNQLKGLAKDKLNSISNSTKKDGAKNNSTDYTLPAEDDTVGSLHPLRIIRNKIIKIFRDIGFSIEDGPEIEEDWYNFTALNFPEYDTISIDKLIQPIKATVLSLAISEMNPVFQLLIIILAFLYPLHSASAFVRLHTPNNGRFLSKNCQILVPCRMTLTPEDSNTVWQYVKKPLISVGGKGATIKHGNSLRQLLDDHTVVKVKVNTKSFGKLQGIARH